MIEHKISENLFYGKRNVIREKKKEQRKIQKGITDISELFHKSIGMPQNLKKNKIQ